MQVTIEIQRTDDVELKTFNVHPSDPSHKSYGFMVGYIQALTDHGIKTTFVDSDYVMQTDDGSV